MKEVLNMRMPVVLANIRTYSWFPLIEIDIELISMSLQFIQLRPACELSDNVTVPSVSPIREIF